MHGGHLIREARKRAGISQAELAERLGTQQPVVARWETATRSPTLESVTKALEQTGFRLVIALESIDPQEEALFQRWLAMTPKERLKANRRMLLTEKWAQKARRVDAGG